jgi:DNA-binding PadR family transcriptional regulator
VTARHGAAAAPNPTAASLLGFLLDGPLTAGELVAVAAQRIGPFWNLTRSQVYRELAGMEASRLVVADEVGPRDTRSYSVTRAGRAAFHAWAAEDPGEATTRLPLLLFLSLGRHVDPAHLREVLVARRAQHQERLAGYRQWRRGEGAAADPFALATVDFGIAYEEAVLAWLDRLPPAVRGRGRLG